MRKPLPAALALLLAACGAAPAPPPPPAPPPLPPADPLLTEAAAIPDPPGPIGCDCEEGLVCCNEACGICARPGEPCPALGCLGARGGYRPPPGRLSPYAGQP